MTTTRYNPGWFGAALVLVTAMLTICAPTTVGQAQALPDAARPAECPPCAPCVPMLVLPESPVPPPYVEQRVTEALGAIERAQDIIEDSDAQPPAAEARGQRLVVPLPW